MCKGGCSCYFCVSVTFLFNPNPSTVPLGMNKVKSYFISAARLIFRLWTWIRLRLISDRLSFPSIIFERLEAENRRRHSILFLDHYRPWIPADTFTQLHTHCIQSSLQLVCQLDSFSQLFIFASCFFICGWLIQFVWNLLLYLVVWDENLLNQTSTREFFISVFVVDFHRLKTLLGLKQSR